MPSSVRPSVRKLYLVRAITRHRFELVSPTLHQTCIMGYSRLVLKIGVINLDLQGHFCHFDSEFSDVLLVRTITGHRFGLKSPNLHQTCTLGCSGLVLKMEVVDFDIKDHFGHFDSEFYEIGHVRVMTRHRHGLQSPNLHQTCILGYSQLVLKINVIDLDLQGHFGHLTQNFRNFSLSMQYILMDVS